MKLSAKQIIADRLADTKRLEAEAPVLREGFGQMVAAYYAPGAMTGHEKELAAVACAVAMGDVPSLANHLANALAAGAERAEILDAAAIGVEFGGGPSYSMVRDHLLNFLDELETDS